MSSFDDLLSLIQSHCRLDESEFGEDHGWLTEACRFLYDEALHLPAFSCSSLTVHYERTQWLRLLEKALVRMAQHSPWPAEQQRYLLSSIALFDLARVLCRGGLIQDMLLGLFNAERAVNQLRQHRHSLTQDSMWTIIDATLRFERSSDAVNVIFDRHESRMTPERDESANEQRGSTPYPSRMRKVVSRMSDSFVVKSRLPFPSDHVSRVLYQRGVGLIRMLRTDLALRLFHGEMGRYADRLNDLVPKYVPSIPVDPFSSEAFKYLSSDSDSFVLYSTGPSRTDHGGRFGHWADIESGVADFGLDMYDYYPKDAADGVESHLR